MAEMTTVAPVAPDEVALAEQRRADERDARFARIHAERERDAAEKRARGEASTVRETIRTRTLEQLAADVPWAPADVVLERESAPPEPTWRAPAGYAEAIVPKRFRAVTVAGYRPETKSQRIALAAAQTWLESVLDGKPAMLALIGAQGTGKSHLLYSAANALLGSNQRVYARPWYRLADELRYGGRVPWAPKHALEAHEVRAQLWEQPIILLDEVRATASTALDENELAKLACFAYDNDVAMLITTNVHPLAEVMGAPAASRFTQIVIDGPDWRQR